LGIKVILDKKKPARNGKKGFPSRPIAAQLTGNFVLKKFILEVVRHSYTAKNILFWGILIIFIINCKSHEKKGSHSADFSAVERKLLCSKYIQEVSRHSYSKFSL
jgi:hypothetical protein